MKQFILIFRMDITSKAKQPSKAEMKMYMQQWNEWMNGIIEQGKLTGGNHLSKQGKVVTAAKTESGPYVAAKNSVAGYFIITAKNMNEAVAIAKACPILGDKKNSVEVRELAAS